MKREFSLKRNEEKRDPAELFHVMCNMFGVNLALKQIKKLGFNPSEEQIAAEAALEKETKDRLIDATYDILRSI